MTYKLVFGLNKVLELCQFDYLVKMDDDVFVNTGRLLDHIEAKVIAKNTYYGFPCKAEELHNVTHFNERLSMYNFTFDDFPFRNSTTYPYGFGIILPHVAVVGFANEYKYVPFVRLIDDMYFGWVMARQGFKCCPSIGIAYMRPHLHLRELNNILIWNLGRQSKTKFTQIQKIYNESIKARDALHVLVEHEKTVRLLPSC